MQGYEYNTSRHDYDYNTVRQANDYQAVQQSPNYYNQYKATSNPTAKPHNYESVERLPHPRASQNWEYIVSPDGLVPSDTRVAPVEPVYQQIVTPQNMKTTRKLAAQNKTRVQRLKDLAASLDSCKLTLGNARELLAAKIVYPILNRRSKAQNGHLCRICEALGVSDPSRFPTPHRLAIHYKVHLGLRDFKCQECPRAFTKNCALRTHQTKAHPRV